MRYFLIGFACGFVSAMGGSAVAIAMISNYFRKDIEWADRRWEAPGHSQADVQAPPPKAKP